MFLKYVVSILLGGVMLWFAFRNEDWSDFGERLAAVDVPLVTGYLLLYIAAHALRIVRWGVLVRALGPVPWSSIISAGAVGYMCIIVFPLRLGELVRPVLVRGQGGVSASAALATVVVERVIDGLLFVALFFVFLSILPPSGNPAVGAVKASAWVAGAIFLGALVVLVGAHLRRQQTVALITRIGNAVHAGMTSKVLRLLNSFLDGLKVLPDRRRLGWFMVLTLVYWVALGVGMLWMGMACHMPDLTLPGAFALLAVLVVGIMIPAGPGFTGTFELALQAGFSLLVLAPDSLANATLYTIMLHVTQLVVQVVFGVGFMAAGKVRVSQVAGAEL
jgi:hypothetical protein